MTTTTTETTTTSTIEPDLARVEAFAHELVGAYVGASVTAMVALGHEVGLFEAAVRGPATSEELANRARLSERHVREWLGSMATAGIFLHDATTGTFELPLEHALLLTGDTAMNQAVIAPLNVHLATHVHEVADRFRHGGGVPYEHYRPEFTSVMDEIGRRKRDAGLVDDYLPRAPGLVEQLEAGIEVADLGCGTGHCVNLMARRFPASTFVGYDLADDALDRGRVEAEAWGLTNVRFERRDVADLGETDRFGLVTAFDAIHDQADPEAMLAGARRALRPGGTFFAVDIRASSTVEGNIGNPLAPMIYAISVLHCMEVSLAADGAGLGTAWGRELACRMLEDAGFEDLAVHEVDDDPFELIYTCRRSVTP